MRVFISSVTYALKDERNSLARILSVVPPYEPLRFEDFVSQDRSSRDACLAGVDAADVYVLLLGPRYGEPLPDSGFAPTEEEFTAAIRQGKPVLVFTKITSEPDEPRQAEFKRKVEHYINGRFRKSFSDPESLNVATLAALRDITTTPAPLHWEQLSQPAAVRWRWDTPALHDQGLYAPVFDVHLIPLAAKPVLAARLHAIPAELARTGRETGFFEESDQLRIGNDSTAAWAWVSDSSARGSAFAERREHEYRGLVVYSTSQVSAFRALPTDFIGALVDTPELQRRASSLILSAARYLPTQPDPTAIAATLSPLDHVFEGDPARVTGRSSGGIRSRQGLTAIMRPVMAVPAGSIIPNVGDIAAEIAATILQSLHDAPR